MTAYEIILSIVGVPLVVWTLKKTHDLAVIVSAIDSRMDGIKSFADALQEIQADIKIIFRMLDRRQNTRPVRNERRQR